jgi:hypothetical protein
MSEKFVYSPLLNFLFRSLNNGNKLSQIIDSAVKFYDKERINEARVLLHEITCATERLSMKVKDEDNVKELCRTMVSAVKDQKCKLPKFVIVDPQEVPTTADEISAVVITRVNEMCRKVDGFIESQSQQKFSQLLTQTSKTSVPPPQPLSYAAVVIKNFPHELKTPESRKEFITQLCENDCDEVVELKRFKTETKLLVKNKNATTRIAEKIAKAGSNLEARAKAPSYIGIVTQVPRDVTEEELKALFMGLIEVKRCGTAQAFKLYFETAADLKLAVESPPMVGIERLNVKNFIFLPLKCYKCHKNGHKAASCTNEAVCGRCASPEHVSSKDNPCTKPMRCVACDSSSHTCYHVRCPENQKVIAEKPNHGN